MINPAPMRIRITFDKTEAMRYTGHLDLHRAWERTFRRAGLPLAYSQGFHPQPKLNLACALPLGFTSQCEMLDAWLETALPLSDISSTLESAVPQGILVTGIQEVDLHLPALQTQVRAAEYRITLLDPVPDLRERLNALLAANNLPRQRRGKLYDLRPLIESAEPQFEDPGQTQLTIRMSARENATGRPEEVLDSLGIQINQARIHRTRLLFA